MGGVLKEGTRDLVVDRFEKGLSGWNERSFSMGGKLTLVSSVLSNLLIYYLSIFRIPVVVGNRLEGIIR